MANKTPPFKMTWPCSHFYAVTPSDAVALEATARWVYVGNTGDIAVKRATDGTSVVIPAVPGGTQLPIEVSHILATGTTATGIVAGR
jgi:hypothetical protein